MAAVDLETYILTVVIAVMIDMAIETPHGSTADFARV